MISISNSPYHLPYNSSDVSLENLVLDQLITPNWYFSVFLFIFCLILYWYCKERFCLGHSWELTPMSQFGDNQLIQYLILWTNIIWIVWLTVRRITNLIWVWSVKGSSDSLVWGEMCFVSINQVLNLKHWWSWPDKFFLSTHWLLLICTIVTFVWYSHFNLIFVLHLAPSKSNKYHDVKS